MHGWAPPLGNVICCAPSFARRRLKRDIPNPSAGGRGPRKNPSLVRRVTDTDSAQASSPHRHKAAASDMAATHTGSLTKTPLGLGLTLDPDNIVACVKDGSQAEREGHIHVGDLVVALNGEVPAHGTGVTAIIQSLPMGAQLEFSLQSAAAREATKSLEPEALAEQRRRRAAASAEVEVKVSKPDQPQIRHI